MEELAVDKRLGLFINHSYEVPVHAYILHQEVIFLDETEPMSSPMKAKGVAELGICRRGGRCLERRLQRQLDKLLGGAPPTFWHRSAATASRSR